MKTWERAADDQLRAAAHASLLLAATVYPEDSDANERVRLIARDLCDLDDRERAAFAELSGRDCCA